jgi:hypothetical protein
MDWSTMLYDALAPVTLDSTTIFASDRDTFVFLVDDLHPIKIGTVVKPDDRPDRGRGRVQGLLRHVVLGNRA